MAVPGRSSRVPSRSSSSQLGQARPFLVTSHNTRGSAAVCRAPPRSLLVHAVAFSWFAFVWCWHLTPGAAQLPGNFGFGWFFRFLTFYSFTLQTLQLGMATVDDWQRTWHGKSRWTKPTDDLACAIFAFTHVVSIMFYTIQGTTKLAVEGGHVQRPPWLDVSVHAFNTMVAWADLISSDRRTFSRTSERLSSVLVMVYLSYLMLCRYMNGRFPYPILNALSFPWGFLGLICSGLVLFVLAFRAGKVINRQLRHVSLSIRIKTTERVDSESDLSVLGACSDTHLEGSSGAQYLSVGVSKGSRRMGLRQRC
eukprot:GHUV01013384.1.p1 GENE.GHUV01013384.1~~GHUV01013384.1.p1  ORF type:complete len:309 (+),score=54.59 GHUV01013384.1:308-1234(+)